MTDSLPTMPEGIVFVRELYGYKGDACLVQRGEEFYAVSSVDAMFSGFETLVFRAAPDGEVLDWCETAGGRGMSREEAIADLAAVLEGGGQ